MSSANQPRLARLTRLLHEAHEEQKRNTRRLEESYHALRISTRLVERRWKELECEISNNNWEDIPRAPTKMTEVENNPSELNSGYISSLRSSHASCQLPDTGEPTPLRTRPRSNNLQAPRPQCPPNIQGPREMPPSTPNSPSRYKTIASSRPTPSHDLQGPRSMSLPKVSIPTRHASLPTREYLVALTQPSGQQDFPKASAIHQTSPKGIDRPPTPHPQHATINNRAKPSAKNVPPPMPSSSQTKPYTRLHPRVTMTDILDAEDIKADQVPGKVRTVERDNRPMTHEISTYEHGVQGHWGSPSDEKNHPSIENGGIHGNQGSGGRARLQKKRKSEDMSRYRE
ncbi:MAG: hypothetical protein Q9186_003944 [Xanthomendoza sp. 1 TL-2023]